jgi:hypothetical protein
MVKYVYLSDYAKHMTGKYCSTHVAIMGIFVTGNGYFCEAKIAILISVNHDLT